ncbi:amino acid adenylation domain-containing protein, partial [Archangium sp.]|uniref:amino acid adenylation domain-containing protein n=1 Tax=Archangium sp. TaxID=1872627 RepID=UPI002ED80BD7
MSLKDRLAALTPEQRRELAQRLKQQQEQQAPAQKPAQPARAKVGVFPLSENQWSMWFLHQLAPQSPSYNVALAMRVRGPVDPAMLERSLNLLAERHAILRTTYETQDEKPVQRVHARLPLALTRHDAPGMTEEQLDGQLRASYLRPFDLEHGPVWRADLFTRAPTEHVLLLVIHHIATDLWSMGMMMEELQHLYRGELRGEPVRLPPLKLDYVDSVQLRREQMTPARQEQLWEYWQSQMKELPGPLELPTDMPRPARWSFRGTTLPMRLGPELSAGLKTLARNEGKTLYTVLLAAFLTLVHRYTGQSDILCGSPLWGRTHPDVQRLAGYFVNFVALRGDMSGDPPFTELMDRLYRRVLGAIENQDYPFHVLCERLGVKQDPSRPRLVEVEFSFDQFNSMPGLDVARDDVQMELKPFLRQQEGQFAINLMLVDVAGEVAGALKYNTDLFTPETMARFAAQLRVLLTSVLRNPRQRLSALSLLTDTDRRQLLETFNTTAQTFPPRASVQSLFEEHAARAPEKPAVACEGRRLSYGELNARANQLAWRLRELGVGPETCVALCLDRSVEMVESILGTWKAGGAYVPLDPALPAERLRTLVEEVAAPVVVTESAKAEVFASLPVRVVCLDTEGAALAALPTHTPPCELHADNVAYVLFTSGSTGRPKGVAVAHGHLLNYIQSVIERLDLGACESFAMVSTFAADLGNTVLFPALCLGGFLHVMSKDRASSPQGMADYFRQHGVDCLKIVPSHLAALMTASEPRDVLPRKRLVVGGEASTWALVERVRTLMPSCEVYNHYGPTETTVGVVCGRAESQKPELAQATVPLGRPIANTRLYVLDAGLRPTPLGVPGELYISGDSVTRGYLGRPDQTADRFMPDPFSPKPGARMYRTGDRARWLADGRVEFLGRADFQVKIRGFRVELGEIEATLRVLPSVKEAVVLALGETSDTRRLVAYLTGQAGAASVEVEAVRRGLRERLPEYMVPSAFVALDALPLTPNGKLDRKALPVPEAAPVLSAEGYVAPRTPTEEILVGLFAQVLSLPAVGVHDDFFAVGGHSLLAMRLVSRLRSALGVEVPLRGLFEAPTAAKLAVRIAELQRQGGGVQVPPVLRVAREGHSPVSFAQQRLWFLDQLMPGQTSYNVPIVLRLTGALDVETLRRTMEEVVRRHESLRTTFT